LASPQLKWYEVAELHFVETSNKVFGSDTLNTTAVVTKSGNYDRNYHPPSIQPEFMKMITSACLQKSISFEDMIINELNYWGENQITSSEVHFNKLDIGTIRAINCLR
jgi:hypothetical protein